MFEMKDKDPKITLTYFVVVSILLTLNTLSTFM